MKALIIAALATATLSAGAFSAQALDETDRALGSGAYIQPNGPAQGVWAPSAPQLSHSGAAVNIKKHKAH